MVVEDFGSFVNCVFCIDGVVGFDVEYEFVEVGVLFDVSGVYFVGYV